VGDEGSDRGREFREWASEVKLTCGRERIKGEA
jgi:hypothetical protein